MEEQWAGKNYIPCHHGELSFAALGTSAILEMEWEAGQGRQTGAGTNFLCNLSLFLSFLSHTCRRTCHTPMRTWQLFAFGWWEWVIWGNLWGVGSDSPQPSTALLLHMLHCTAARATPALLAQAHSYQPSCCLASACIVCHILQLPSPLS